MKLPVETEETIVCRYRDGATMEQIAAEEFVGLATVCRVLRRHGVESRSRSRPQLAHREYERTIELYESGLSSEDVGRVVGVTGAAVRQRLRLAGVPRRPGGTRSRRVAS